MFDPSAPHIIILLIVVLLLFGSTRLPGAAKALGQSMHIFKKSVKGLEEDKQDTPVNLPPAALTANPPQPAPGQDATQQQLQDLQRQLRELQQQSAGTGGAPAPEAPQNQQTS
ncbi:MAG TPA: twin-arginine translocase TatA/TatE family subunit [Streptosporangiaceae bacterium]|jgi:sec-independent protein translocase protein TatA